MRTVNRKEFKEFVDSNPDLVSHPTEGHQISVMQYLSADSQKVRAQAVYSRLVEGYQAVVTYYIED